MGSLIRPAPKEQEAPQASPLECNWLDPPKPVIQTQTTHPTSNQSGKEVKSCLKPKDRLPETVLTNIVECDPSTKEEGKNQARRRKNRRRNNRSCAESSEGQKSQEPCIKFADNVETKSINEDDPRSEYIKSVNQSFDEGNKSFHSTGQKEPKRQLKRVNS
jgi:hypothetical protein